MHQAATIRIQREATKWQDRARKYKVLLDNVVIGSLHQGESAEYEIDPGPHALKLAMDWTGSKVVNFNIETGESIAFRCRPAVRPSLATINVFKSLRHRDMWIQLERVGD